VFRRSLGALALCLGAVACSDDADPESRAVTTTTTRAVGSGPTTLPPTASGSVDELTPLPCTAADADAFVGVLDRAVLPAVGPALRSDPDCTNGLWEWSAEGLRSAVSDPSALLDAIDAGLGDWDRTDRDSGDAVWFGECALTLRCRIDVVVAPDADGVGSEVEVRATGSHGDYRADRNLIGDEYAAHGITRIAGAPVSSYCADAMAAIHGRSYHRFPTSVLSTERPSDPRSCPTIPVSFDFARPQRHVAVQFWGAAVPYALRAYDAAGGLVAEDTELASPDVHDRLFRVSVDAGAATITRVTFGYEKAETAVTTIVFGVAAVDETVVRFDQERSGS
jgi:hypothetical protein